MEFQLQQQQKLIGKNRTITHFVKHIIEVVFFYLDFSLWHANSKLRFVRLVYIRRL